LVLDQGTSETNAMIIKEDLSIMAMSSFENPLRITEDGYVEHFASDIKKAVQAAISDVLKLADVYPKHIAGIAVTNQRETTCLFDKNGEPKAPFISWQCRRSADICDRLKNEGLAKKLHEITGLHLDPYFSATKLLWLFENDPSLKIQAENKKILFGTIDTYLAHWLSNGKLHITDATNASRTMLMDLYSLQYSEECLRIFGVPFNCLPEIVSNIGPYGKTSGLSFLPDGIPIVSLIGDQQSALVGQQCFNRGEAKATFGTGCFILQNIGEDIILSRHGLLTSVGYFLGEHPIYCMEGAAFASGAGVQFLRDNFHFIKNTKEIEELAQSVSDSHGVVFIPGFSGIGAPLWKPEAKAAIFGLSRGSTQGHVARALLEGIALQNALILSAMSDDGASIKSLKVDGGSAENDLLIQIQADVAQIDCVRDKEIQKTAMGAAFLAAKALGFPIEQKEKKSKNLHIFSPKISSELRDNMLKRYRSYLEKL